MCSSDLAGIIWIIIGVAMLISKKYRKYGVLVLAGLLIGLIIGNGIVKNVVQRARPCWIDTNFKMLIAIPKDYSFPSGHTLARAVLFSFGRCHKKSSLRCFIQHSGTADKSQGGTEKR